MSKSSKNRLGRGIDALMGDSGSDFDIIINNKGRTNGSGSIENIPVDKIVANPDQPRKNFNEDTIAELSESIKQKGIIQPIILEKKGDIYQIVAGERRFRASKMAGLETIPSIIKEFTEEEIFEIALIENIHREDISAIEEARAYKQLIDKFHITQQEVAEKVGKKRSTVANSLRLLKLEPEILDALENNKISAGHGRALQGIINPADQKVLFGRILKDNLSVRSTEQQASLLNEGKRTKKKEEKKSTSHSHIDPDLMGIEQQFIDLFGTKVQIKGSFKSGKIEISYFSSSDLERILDLIGK